MVQSNTASNILPDELLEMQLAQIDLLMAMYPESVEMSELSTTTLEATRNLLELNGSSQDLPLKAFAIDLLLQIEVAESTGSDLRNVQLEISFPLDWTGEAAPIEPPPARIRIQQATWMNKAQVNAISTQMPKNDDIFAIIEAIPGIISSYISQQTQMIIPTVPESDTSINRVWFYFPSISTRAKRDDIVNYAPSYGLTGFLLAGKPGILCLEGGSQAVDDYMKFIKTESWGDIPAHHKKVSERYRQADISKRVFNDMQEITDQLERRGERANRNDMKALEAWLGTKGLQEAFAKVLI